MCYPADMNDIQTSRLQLVPATVEHVCAEIEDPGRFFDMLGIEPAAGWPSENSKRHQGLGAAGTVVTAKSSKET